MTDQPSAPLADGTDQPVVGRACGQCGLPISPGESALRHYGTFSAHLEYRCHELERALRHELQTKCAKLELDLAAHRYALELQNRACGLPLDNEKYDAVADLLNDTRHALIEALNCIRVGEPPWDDDEARWRKIAGLDTANARAVRTDGPPRDSGTH